MSIAIQLHGCSEPVNSGEVWPLSNLEEVLGRLNHHTFLVPSLFSQHWLDCKLIGACLRDMDLAQAKDVLISYDLWSLGNLASTICRMHFQRHFLVQATPLLPLLSELSQEMSRRQAPLMFTPGYLGSPIHRHLSWADLGTHKHGGSSQHLSELHVFHLWWAETGEDTKAFWDYFQSLPRRNQQYK